MKKIISISLCLLIILLTIGLKACDDDNDNDNVIEVPDYIPKNLTITVVGRLMTVTWDPVENATGYEITTTSIGCGSGNKIINTKTKTAALYNGDAVTSVVSTIPTINNVQAGGSVTFISETEFTIWLMAEEDTAPFETTMATSVKAKIKSIGDDVVFTESEYSDELVLDKEQYLPPTVIGNPKNLSISVVGRLMTVTWDAVPHATGYIIYTNTDGCGSGKRIVNTISKIATFHNGSSANCVVSETPNTSVNGYVTITGDTSFTIWLMAAEGSTTEAMANWLTAKIMTIGNGNNYLDSEYSEEVKLNKTDYK